MGIFFMFAGFLFFALGLALAFSERWGKKANSAAPVILIVSIILICSGVVINKEDNYSISDYIDIQFGDVKSDNQNNSVGVLGNSDYDGERVPGELGGERLDPGTNEDGERPKGWANGLGGSFERWKAIFGPPDEVELINNTGKASFLDRYIHAEFSDGKVTSFTLDLQKINSTGVKLKDAKNEVDQMIPPDSELLDEDKSIGEKTHTERYKSEILKKDFMEKDIFDTEEDDSKKERLIPDQFNIIYHELDNGNIYKVHVKTEPEDKTK